MVDIGKLRDYCLSVEHVRGRHKARMFASKLGLTSIDAEFLRQELLRAARDADATFGDVDQYGARYTIDFDWFGIIAEVRFAAHGLFFTATRFPDFRAVIYY